MELLLVHSCDSSDELHIPDCPDSSDRPNLPMAHTSRFKQEKNLQEHWCVDQVLGTRIHHRHFPLDLDNLCNLAKHKFCHI